jgi:probable F420-dependent oxidoreductase
MPHPKPFRFGNNTLKIYTRQEWVEHVRKVESIGFDTMCFGDHHWMGLAPLTAMMSAADATTKLRLASFVFGNDFRHPALLAREAATLDVLSDGRLEFGIGSGWQRGDYDTRGIPFDPPGVRVSRLEEAVQIVKLFFTGEPFSFSGKYYTIKELTGVPRPVQQPRPPVMVGGGSRRSLSIAGREADIVSLNFHTTAEGGLDFRSSSSADVMRMVAWAREGAGERAGELEFNIVMLSVVVTPDRRKAAEAFVQRWNMDPSEQNLANLLESPFFLFGTVEQMVETLKARREQYGISYFTVMGDDNAEPFAPVLERLAGS